ncbi:hypothetical protein DWB85_18555 [Seongchinamella sediminis]|uniref:C-type lysozyme inhibitor domain-containing protein n=1 Tax=Seongchinamella sediminis TaxID=2283635 RepID=A0A3L7DS04_9GAMM|nr:MliC family protein [Seongchinamella sediminis]RLQ20268.1 hypothetical protein DWB85_18555 [Seongchinamella sediminis]
MTLNTRAVLIASALLSACTGQADETGPATGFQPDSRPLARTLVYECTGIEFISRLGPGEMALWLEDRYLVLSQVRAASGTRYEEGDVMFWSRGEEAMLEVDGVRYSDCRLNPSRAPWEDARRRGVEFRAVGNEPGWHLEVRGQENLLFVGDYGASRLLFSEFDTTEEGGLRHYRAQVNGDSIEVTVNDSPCYDSMSGEQFPCTVELQLNGRSFHGCGRTLDYPWQ